LFDVAHKYSDRWIPQYRTIDGCVSRWLAAAHATETQAGLKNRLFVKYEELAANPEAVASRVCGFAGIPYCEDMLENRSGSYARIVRDREPHKKNVQEAIASRNGTKFEQLFDAAQRSYIISKLGDWPARLDALCSRAEQTIPKSHSYALS
jgi:hypothetical protein